VECETSGRPILSKFAETLQADEESRVLCDPFIIGEIACGKLRKRAEVLSLLADLPRPPTFWLPIRRESENGVVELTRASTPL
jgi:hypothetical protein